MATQVLPWEKGRFSLGAPRIMSLRLIYEGNTKRAPCCLMYGSGLARCWPEKT